LDDHYASGFQHSLKSKILAFLLFLRDVLNFYVTTRATDSVIF